MFTSSGDIKKKTENDKKNHEKYSFLQFLGLKTKKFENVSDPS